VPEVATGAAEPISFSAGLAQRVWLSGSDPDERFDFGTMDDLWSRHPTRGMQNDSRAGAMALLPPCPTKAEGVIGQHNGTKAAGGAMYGVSGVCMRVIIDDQNARRGIHRVQFPLLKTRTPRTSRRPIRLGYPQVAYQSGKSARHAEPRRCARILTN
jgi:hypothetical protein